MDIDSDAPDSPVPDKLWPRKKIALIFGGCLLFCLGFLLFYDNRLEPYDDLLPSQAAMPDDRENGYAYLREKWGKMPPISRNDRDRLTAIRQGREAWDPAFVAGFLTGREDILRDTDAALAMPHWRSDSSASRMIQWLTLLQLDTDASIRAGDTARALEILVRIHRLGECQMRNSTSLLSLIIAMSSRDGSASICCTLLATGKLDDRQLQTISQLWEAEPLTKEVLSEILNNEAESLRRSLLTSEGQRSLFPSDSRFVTVRSLLFKKNQRLNRYHQVLRTEEQHLLEPCASIATSPKGRIAAFIPQESGFIRWLNPNVYGDQALRAALESLSITQSYFAPRALFTTRAMQLRLALYRWQRAHGGEFPSKVEELSPDFLNKIPADPWDGKPLRWDAASGIIFAVGSDWRDDLPTIPKPEIRSWFLGDASSPGLRLILPPAPPPAPPLPPAASSKARPRAKSKASSPPASNAAARPGTVPESPPAANPAAPKDGAGK